MEIVELYKKYLSSSGVITDSRKVTNNTIFFALKGDNFDGNKFATEVIDKGACCSVVDDTNLPDNPKFIKVQNALNTLQELAAYHRQQLNIPIVGLTGTNGKTTTKELIYTVLSTKYKVCSTAGNLNNHIGVPLTLLSMDKSIEIAVIEMGASSKGEIEYLTNIVKPNVGLITNVGKAHLLGFGSLEGVMSTKGELYDYLYKNNGLVFYNSDNTILTGMISQRPGLQAKKYGLILDGYTIEETTEKNPFLNLKCPDGRTIKSNLIGNYNAENIIAAITVGRYFDINLTKAEKAIEAYMPSNNRSQLMRAKYNSLIIDAYNANPSSMKVSLENFHNISAKRKALIIGDMLELGEEAQKEHLSILNLIREINPEKIYFVGKEFKNAAEKIEYFNTKALFFDTSLALKEYLIDNSIKKFTILIKGSRGTRLEHTIEAL